MMFEQLGLGHDGRPVEDTPGSLLRKPITSSRYELDLVQLQRTTRATEANRRPKASDGFADFAPPLPEQGPQSLPKMLFESTRARRTGARRDPVLQPDRATPLLALRERGSPASQPSEKKLPACAQDFLRGRISGSPVDITLHRGGGGIPNWFDHSVTYGRNIHLAGPMFDRTDESALKHKFHEIGHTSQNARMGLNSFDHFAAYLPFVGHDASPLEKAADKFAKRMYEAYQAAGLQKSCPF